MGRGASVTTDEGLLCLGGADASGPRADVLLLTWDGAKLTTVALPPLPHSCVGAAAARVGRKVHVSTGTRDHWSLDLKAPDRGWTAREPLPGPARVSAIGASRDGAFFLIGGVDAENAEGHLLNDAYRHRDGEGWCRLADLPRGVANVPSAAIGPAHLFLFGDGASDLLAYHTITNTWTRHGERPVGIVESVSTNWRGRAVLFGADERQGAVTTPVWSFREESERVDFGRLNYATLTFYPIIMVGISLLVGRKGTTDEFFRGGQRVPWWAAGLSIFATVLSSITYMAIPAKAYATDWSFTLANLAILIIAPVVVFVFLPFFRSLDVTTAYEYLERRFNVAARWFGSLSFIALQLGRTAIVLYLPALALATVSSFSIELCLVVMGVITLAMTYLGGIESVIWTDVAQTIILFLGAGTVLFLVAAEVPGGASGTWRVAHDDAKFFGNVSWALDPYRATGTVILLGNVLVLLGNYVGSQDVVQRYVSTPTEKAAAQAIWLNAVMSIPATLLFFAVGTALYVFYKTHPDRLDPALSTEAIFPLFMVREMPAGLGGLAVAGVFAAAQPTSSLNSIATAWVTDFHTRLFPEDDDERKLVVARRVTLLSGLCGTGLAFALTRVDALSSFDAFLSLLGLTGSSLVGLYVLGVFSRRATGRGALVGAFASVCLLLYVNRMTSLSFFTYGLLGIGSCVLVGWLASLVLTEPTRDLKGLTIHAGPSRLGASVSEAR